MQVSLAFGFGLVTASVLALGAVGFTLQFGVTNIFNLSYGQVMTVGMFVAYLVNVSAGDSIWLGLAAGAVAGAILSGLFNMVIFMPSIRRGVSPGGIVIVSLALGIVIENVLLAAGGGAFRALNVPSSRSLHFLGMILTVQQIVIIALAIAAMVVLHVVLRYTYLGKAMRATAANAALARTSGIATDRVTMIAWIVSGAFCGAAGVTFAINLATFDHTTGSNLLLIVIAAAVFGGVGQPYGAMLGAFVVGMSSELAALVSPSLKEVVAFTILALMLLVRPNGLIPSSGAKPAEITT